MTRYRAHAKRTVLPGNIAMRKVFTIRPCDQCDACDAFAKERRGREWRRRTLVHTADYLRDIVGLTELEDSF